MNIEKHRQDAHLKIKALLERTGLMEKDTQERINSLKEIDFNQFFSLLKHLNGMLRNIDSNRRNSDDTANTVILGKDMSIVEYIAPSSGIIYMNDFFDLMQKNISVENIDEYAIRLEYAIVFAHLFEDGNGRTSRYAKRLLKRGEMEMNDAGSSLDNRNVDTIGKSANELAVSELFKENLPEKYRQIFDINNPSDVLLYIHAITSDFKAYGYAYPVKELALLITIETLGFEGVDISNNSFYLNMMSSRENEYVQAKISYEAIYEELQGQLFWKVQKMIDEPLERGEAPEVFFSKRVNELERS